MNTVIFLLWFADFVSGVNKFFGFMAFVFILCGGIATCTNAIFSKIAEDDDSVIPVVEVSKRFTKLLWIGFVFAFIALVTPSRLVVHTAAAVKGGETIAKTDLAKKTLKLLELKIDKELKRVQ